jgi:hypothetical protein
MMAAVLFVTLVQQPRPPADTAAGRPCKVLIDSVGRQARQVEVKAGETNVFAGGGVLAHCAGASSMLSADSVAWFAGVGRFDMIGQQNMVHIRDTAVTLDARNAAYYLRQERLDAHNQVVAVNRATGSVLRGPNLTYYRAVKGVRDTLEMYASGRPSIDYRASPDSGEPYVIVADRVRLKGNDRMWGGGTVTIDRSDFAARGDSMQLDQVNGFGVLVGKPLVHGTGTRSYTLTGTRIELGLTGREVRLVKALGDGVATGSDWRLTADTIHLHVDRRKLQQAFAWGPRDSTHARALSTLYTIRADSLALDLPGEVLTEARAFRHAFSTSKTDSSRTAEVNWIAGDSLIARWAQVPDSAGRPQNKLRQLIARRAARALTHMRTEPDSTKASPRDSTRGATARDSTRGASARDSTRAHGPSLNYSRGAGIDILLTADKIDRVIVVGRSDSSRADGVQLDPKPPAPDTTKKAPKPAPSPRPARPPQPRRPPRP